MASGSSGRPNPGSKGFDFASDDILCSYDDFSHQDSSNGPHSDPNPPQDFQKSRISRSSMFPTANAYTQPEVSPSEEMVSTVERTMKKHADNLMRFLEGLSSRMSQLELYCYNVDKSIAEMRSDLGRDYGDLDSRMKSLEKHMQEVHRSVQILRDKQELADTQKELAKLQLAQKESSFQEERAVVSASETKKTGDASDSPNTQLALALPSQIAAQPSHPVVQQQSVAPPPQPPSQAASQLPPYYLPSNPQGHLQPSYLPADAQYRVPQLAPQAPQPQPAQVNQTSQTQQYPQYQQQWPQQVSQPMPPPQQQPMPPPQQQPMPPPQQPPMQPGQQPPMQQPNQMRAPPFLASQPANQPPAEAMASSMPMQVPFSGFPQHGASRPEAMPYGYGGSGRPAQPQPSPPHMKGGFPSQPADGYASGGPHPPISSAGTYMLYDNEGGRSHLQPTHYSQSGYPPANPSIPNVPPPNSSSLMIRSSSPQQYVRSHPYNELIDKLVSMGYRGDHVVSVIQRLEESGQPVDFNAVLDRLNGHSSGSSQRSW